MADKNPNNPRFDDEIDLIELIITLWKGRNIIMLATLAGAILSLGVSLLLPTQFSVRSQFISELNFVSQGEIERFIRQTPEFVQIQTRISFENSAKDEQGGRWTLQGNNLNYTHADQRIAQRQIIALYERALPKAKNAATLFYKRQLVVLENIEKNRELLSDPNATTKVRNKLALDELVAAERLGQLYLSDPKRVGTSRRLVILMGILLGGVIGTIAILVRSAIANYKKRQHQAVL
ncbi:MAG: Wzz/FepE/Etk N-terminal domain-containing protein [Candidatus Puniceispirillaceae bacterium]